MTSQAVGWKYEGTPARAARRQRSRSSPNISIAGSNGPSSRNTARGPATHAPVSDATRVRRSSRHASVPARSAPGWTRPGTTAPIHGQIPTGGPLAEGWGDPSALRSRGPARALRSSAKRASAATSGSSSESLSTTSSSGRSARRWFIDSTSAARCPADCQVTTTMEYGPLTGAPRSRLQLLRDPRRLAVEDPHRERAHGGEHERRADPPPVAARVLDHGRSGRIDDPAVGLLEERRERIDQQDPFEVRCAFDKDRGRVED